MPFLLTTLRAPWWRRLVQVAALLVVTPWGIGEAAHVLTYGHFGLGLHVDLVEEYQHGVYSLWGVDLTPVPLPARVCGLHSGETGHALFRYAVERWTNQTRTWTVVHAGPPVCPEPDQPTWTVLWPGFPVQLAPGDSPARDDWPFRNGDRWRFTAFALYDRTADNWLQIRVASAPLLVTNAPAEGIDVRPRR